MDTDDKIILKACIEDVIQLYEREQDIGNLFPLGILFVTYAECRNVDMLEIKDKYFSLILHILQKDNKEYIFDKFYELFKDFYHKEVTCSNCFGDYIIEYYRAKGKCEDCLLHIQNMYVATRDNVITMFGDLRN